MSKFTIDKFISTKKLAGFTLRMEDKNRINNRCLAMDQVVIPRMQELLGFELSTKSIQNHCTFKKSCDITEPECTVMVRYLNERLLSVIFTDEKFTIEEYVDPPEPEGDNGLEDSGEVPT